MTLNTTINFMLNKKSYFLSLLHCKSTAAKLRVVELGTSIFHFYPQICLLSFLVQRGLQRHSLKATALHNFK